MRDGLITHAIRYNQVGGVVMLRQGGTLLVQDATVCPWVSGRKVRYFKYTQIVNSLALAFSYKLRA